jgi:hypothetical protein
MFSQVIEGFNFLPLKGKSIYMSFWVRSPITGTYCVGIRNAAGTRSLVKTYTISVANTWEFKTISFTHDPTGTWDYTNGAGLYVSWVLMSGSTFQTTADTWQTGNFVATSAQVNFVGTIGSATNAFFISQVQLYEGTTSLDFEGVPLEAELRQCMRYYEKTQPYESLSFTTLNFYGSLRGSSTEVGRIAKFLVEKRVMPTVLVNAVTSGTLGVLRDLTIAADAGAVTADPSPTGIRFTHAGLTASRWYAAHWRASAEL